MKTFIAKNETVKRNWLLINAENKTLGKLATVIATILKGKHKPEYTPHADAGDFVIIINAKKIKVTGNKLKNKMYYHHTGYIGGIKSISLRDLLIKNPKYVIEHAVKGMLPKNSLGRSMFAKLKVFENEKHTHQAQQPTICNRDIK